MIFYLHVLDFKPTLYLNRVLHAIDYWKIFEEKASSSGTYVLSEKEDYLLI
jgi:hypothetical protein